MLGTEIVHYLQYDKDWISVFKLQVADRFDFSNPALAPFLKASNLILYLSSLYLCVFRNKAGIFSLALATLTHFRCSRDS